MDEEEVEENFKMSVDEDESVDPLDMPDVLGLEDSDDPEDRYS